MSGNLRGREAFEAWAGTMGWTGAALARTPDDSRYAIHMLEQFWKTWQAACRACAEACDKRRLAGPASDDEYWNAMRAASENCADACRALGGEG